MSQTNSSNNSSHIKVQSESISTMFLKLEMPKNSRKQGPTSVSFGPAGLGLEPCGPSSSQEASKNKIAEAAILSADEEPLYLQCDRSSHWHYIVDKNPQNKTVHALWCSLLTSFWKSQHRSIFPPRMNLPKQHFQDIYTSQTELYWHKAMKQLRNQLQKSISGSAEARVKGAL